MEEKTLDQLKVGEKAVVKYVNNNILPSKLYEMGLIPGTSVKVQFTGPYNDPICIGFGKSDTKIALRKKEAQYIIVEI